MLCLGDIQWILVMMHYSIHDSKFDQWFQKKWWPGKIFEMMNQLVSYNINAYNFEQNKF